MKRYIKPALLSLLSILAALVLVYIGHYLYLIKDNYDGYINSWLTVALILTNMGAAGFLLLVLPILMGVYEKI